jgi:hypothetical protein
MKSSIIQHPLAAAIVIAVAFLCGASVRPATSGADSWPGCDSFTTQPQAQTYWEHHGRPPVGDRDQDGKVCEDLPANVPAPKTGCVHTSKVVAVGLSRRSTRTSSPTPIELSAKAGRRFS